MKPRRDHACGHCGIKAATVEEITLLGGGTAPLCPRCVHRYDVGLRHPEHRWMIRLLDRKYPPRAA